MKHSKKTKDAVKADTAHGAKKNKEVRSSLANFLQQASEEKKEREQQNKETRQ